MQLFALSYLYFARSLKVLCLFRKSPHFPFIIYKLSSVGKSGLLGFDKIRVLIFYKLDSGIAYLYKVKTAYTACHSHRNSMVGIYQNGGKSGGRSFGSFIVPS